MKEFTRSTPWGYADHQKTIAPGIVSCSTPSHGGYWISSERYASMPECLRNTSKWSSSHHWYEEDQDWAIVALAFPELFDARSCFYALRTAEYATSRKEFDWLPENLRGPAWSLNFAEYLATEQGKTLTARAKQHEDTTA